MKLNEQVPEKRAPGDGTVIAVNSIFHTIQGEGPFAGSPAVFVRLAGCNLQCPLCDTEYTKRTEASVDDVVTAVRDAIPFWPGGEPNHHNPGRAHCNLVVITGGEPFRQNIGKLVRELVTRGYKVQIETNGTFCPTDDDFPFHLTGPYAADGSRRQKVWIVCSPKTSYVHRKLAPHVDAFKYVATAASLEGSPDGLPMYALDHPTSGMLFRPPYKLPGWNGEVYLQPVDEQNHYPNKNNLDAVVASCLKHGYRLCIQIHKLTGVP